MLYLLIASIKKPPCGGGGSVCDRILICKSPTWVVVLALFSAGRLKSKLFKCQPAWRPSERIDLLKQISMQSDKLSNIGSALLGFVIYDSIYNYDPYKRAVEMNLNYTSAQLSDPIFLHGLQVIHFLECFCAVLALLGALSLSEKIHQERNRPLISLYLILPIVVGITASSFIEFTTVLALVAAGLVYSFGSFIRVRDGLSVNPASEQ
jgi:hypothetical protein